MKAVNHPVKNFTFHLQVGRLGLSLIAAKRYLSLSLYIDMYIHVVKLAIFNAKSCTFENINDCDSNTFCSYIIFKQPKCLLLKFSITMFNVTVVQLANK